MGTLISLVVTFCLVGYKKCLIWCLIKRVSIGENVNIEDQIIIEF